LNWSNDMTADGWRQIEIAFLRGLLTKWSQSGGMKHFFALLLMLSACNTAGPHFRGLPATTVTVDGSTFDVRVRGELAEAIRTNAEYAPRFGPIRERAGRAMAMVSGCEVVEVRGDQAQATGILKCGSKRKTPIARTTGVVECSPMPGSEVEQAFGGVTIDLACNPA